MASLIHNHILRKNNNFLKQKKEDEKYYIQCDYDIFVLRNDKQTSKQNLEKSTHANAKKIKIKLKKINEKRSFLENLTKECFVLTLFLISCSYFS